MTRSLSFKLPSQLGGGNKSEKRILPKKLDVDNWMKGKPPSGSATRPRQDDQSTNIRLGRI